VAENLNADVYILEKLIGDLDEDVRIAAKKSCNDRIQKK
jgi:hypothetical protein